MATLFLRSGITYRTVAEDSLNMYDKLPAGNYIIKCSPTGEFYLESIEPFEFKGKIYGDTTKNADRIINTYKNRAGTTGVLLDGEKGSGKTLLARKLANKMAEEGHPTLVINSAFFGDTFNAFIQSIDQPCMMLFDEFEKVYDSDEQQSLLTLFDGVFPSKKLVVFTVNDRYRINQHMRNRPGRIFYHISYQGLSTDFIREYCQDVLKNKDNIDGVCHISAFFAEFNFDMLVALVEEMNRYNETANEAMRMLNAKPGSDDAGKFSVGLVVDGVTYDSEDLWPEQWNGNPISRDEFDIELHKKTDDVDGDHDCVTYTFQRKDLQYSKSNENEIVFVNKNGNSAIFRKKRTELHTWPVDY